MELPAKYDPALTEDKWYAYWLENKFFHSEPDEREPYTIVIPPPNVTGILHMGHVLNNTLNDVLVRKARMDGKNACWVPGTDHASIATENKVVQKLAAEGIKKEDLTREEFLKHAWEWKEKHGGIILSQLRKLGASCDWDRTKFTMDPELSEAVISTFVYFYNKGYIYRGVRMVNWDPVGLTAVSDEEVVHKDTVSKFYHLRYFISDGNGNPTDKYIIIATTRPETIMADAAICINPEDERYHYLKGKKVLIPLINKEIPVIEDSYVAMDFGTGCLKVTPAHDVNDYEIGMRHNLPVLDIIDDHGRLNEKAQILVGEDRFDARKKIVKMLEEAGNLEKMEDYTSPVGYSERTNAVIEPRLSMQWFLKMEALAKDALESVESGNVKLIPDKYRNTYRHWMENVRDWCISRQLWWGQRIPAYYLPDGQVVVAETPEKALEAAQKIDASLTAADLRLIVKDIVSCRTAQKHTQTHCVSTILGNQVKRIRRVAESFGHLASELVAYDTCEIYVTERNVIHELISSHDHTCHPEEEDIRTCNEVICRIVICKVSIRFSVRMTCLIGVKYRDRPEP